MFFMEFAIFDSDEEDVDDDDDDDEEEEKPQHPLDLSFRSCTVSCSPYLKITTSIQLIKIFPKGSRDSFRSSLVLGGGLRFSKWVSVGALKAGVIGNCLGEMSPLFERETVWMCQAECVNH